MNERRENENRVLEAIHSEEEQLLKNDIREVMGTKAGRRLFMTAICKGGVYSYSKRDDDKSYVAGRRDAAIELMKVANRHAQKESLLALIEQNEVAAERQRQIDEAKRADRAQENEHGKR